ncbi:aldehyde dehydrogenase [Plectosphaerella cucumerina]|uniref:aldehyde dehydrogenase (NAD(+)) n=1 Tax=Plectosphaerella cucumerina TaxID=40658 RepID=A0A8K0TU31_9PEZI|nr:aldehyde dehydrogenase [Plectosphaerella cucumerina]
MTSVDFTSFSNIVAGALRSGDSAGHGVDPSTRKPLWDIPNASAKDLDDAVAAAKSAFPKWSRTHWKQRQALLRQAAELLREHGQGMAKLISAEGGKPPQFADLEVQHALRCLEFYADCEEPTPQIVQDDEELRLTLHHAPIGIVGAICPWNFPLILGVGKIAPALLTGNTVIIKPSPFTPYSIVKFTEIVAKLFPAGVLQALNGGPELGPMICEHPDIRKISFTGSTATGKKIMSSASSKLKDITLELGGNSASIICPDVDVNIAAPQVALGSFFNSGQLCVASKRLFVHEDIYDAFLKKLVEVVGSWKVGAPSLEGVMLGPVQNEMQYKIVRDIFEDSVRNGHKFALGGLEEADDSSYIIRPAIIDNPPDSSVVVTKEAFGPIVPVLKWSNEQDLMARVNDTESGLGGAVWSDDLVRAHRLAAQIEAGTVWINSFEKPLPQAFLSGHKESGVGGEGGKHGLFAFLKPQMIHLYKNPVVSSKI